MAKTANDLARFLNQCANGYRTRLCAFVPVIVALDRTANNGVSHPLADAINSETLQKAMIVMPQAGTVVRCFANADLYATQAAGGTATARLYKAVIGASDVALCAAFNIGADVPPTAKTAQNGTLSTVAGALDVLEGQEVYVELAVSADAVSACTAAGVVGIEYYPTEQ